MLVRLMPDDVDIEVDADEQPEVVEHGGQTYVRNQRNEGKYYATSVAKGKAAKAEAKSEPK